MRISINIPEKNDNTNDDEQGFESTSINPSIIKLTSNGKSDEFILIELQGNLEIENNDLNGNETIGRLEFQKENPDKPLLFISHHKLEGKIVNLIKPLVVLEQKKRIEQGNALQDIDMNKESEAKEELENKNDEEEDEEEEDHHHHQEPFPSTPTPIRKITKTKEIEKNIESSSPIIPFKRFLGSELDYSSPINNDERIVKRSKLENSSNQEEIDEFKKFTSTYMDVVCIIKKKLLFSKRPEPVVQLNSIV